MKKFAIFLIIIALLLCGCSAADLYGIDTDTEADTEASEIYTIEHNGMTFEVDVKQWTITHNADVYHVHYDQAETETMIRITYPNGATYHQSQTGGVDSSGNSDDYDPVRYVPGDVLIEALNQTARNKEVSPISILLGVLCILLGAFNLFMPRLAWRVQYGWACKNAEPTALAVLINRVNGVIAIFLGVILILF